MSNGNTSIASEKVGQKIRVRGLVQGVGFRPCIWRLAQDQRIVGNIINDSAGVLIEAWGSTEQLQQFLKSIHDIKLPLARIEQIQIESSPLEGVAPDEFQILKSRGGDVRTSVAAEAASCAACREDTFSPANRRYRYAFTNCTHCGPRLSIIKSVPYDRQNTSMHMFKLCPACLQEYENPADRRYHAQPTACRICGPQLVLSRLDRSESCIESLSQLDEVDAAATLLLRGEIVAIKGLGGFQLCCDASNDDAVRRLRQRKRRYDKPFALMARDLEIIRCYCRVSDAEAELLESSSAPIVLMESVARHDLSAAVAPGVSTLGFMLPNTPMHHLLMERLDKPIICSSGNLAEEPQCTDNDDARARLFEIADYILEHNRDIINRLDDSVLRIAFNRPCMLRRARGYAPAPIPLPPGFAAAREIIAMGGELKNTLCFVKDDSAILSQHIGDLAEALTFEDYKRNLALYENLFQHRATEIAVDRHPEYLSTKLGKRLSQERQIKLHEIQHHHAHIAACLAENNWPLKAGPVLGVALDGLGYGDDAFWGGEFLLADYFDYERLGTFKPVALIGGSQAIKEPWRNTYAHIMAAMGWDQYKSNFAELELTAFLQSKPLHILNGMLKSNTNVPTASSCGRLFDAVAAAIGVCREQASYEGQAAIELEAIVSGSELYDGKLSYPFTISLLKDKGIPCIEPLAMWQALLADLTLKTEKGIMSARFHKGLAQVVVNMVRKLTMSSGGRRISTVALSGGVFQNKILLEQVIEPLEKDKYKVLTHSRTPANDGSIALGQALICAARTHIETKGF